jgi:hypothetical protein
MRIQPPDPHRKHCRNPRCKTMIHEPSPTLQGWYARKRDWQTYAGHAARVPKVTEGNHDFGVYELTSRRWICGFAAVFRAGEGRLIEVLHRAGSGSARISATSTWSGGGTWRRGALGRNGKYRQLRCKLFTVALGAIRLFVPIHQGLKRVVTFFADVFKNRHCGTPVLSSITI